MIPSYATRVARHKENEGVRPLKGNVVDLHSVRRPFTDLDQSFPGPQWHGWISLTSRATQ